jgi:hypothetical protein
MPKSGKSNVQKKLVANYLSLFNSQPAFDVPDPSSMPELFARIRANLPRIPSASAQNANTIEFGDVRVDLGAHRICVRGQDVHVTPKQFEVLEYFRCQSKHRHPSCEDSSGCLAAGLRY